MDVTKNDTPLALAIVRAIISKVEAINPYKKNAKELLDELFEDLAHIEDLAHTLEAAEELKSFAAAFKSGMAKQTDDNLLKAAQAFAPFFTFKAPSQTPSTDEPSTEDCDQFAKSVTDDCSEIIKLGGLSAMEQPSMDDFEMPEATAEEISWYKWTLLVVLYAIEFGLLFGCMVTIWNLVRALGGVSYKDKTRVASEIGAAILVAIILPDLQALLRHILSRAKLAPVFEGQVSAGWEHFEMVCTGILGGEAIHMGIKAGLAIAGGDLEKFKYAMFLGNFMAFFAGGLINAAGQVAVGRKLLVGPKGEPFPDTAIEAFKAFGGRYVDMDIALYQRLMHALNWGCYEIYGGGFALLANNAVGRELALGGSLGIFVTAFKMSFFWAGKLQKRRAARVSEA